MFSVVAVLFTISEEDNAAITTLFENNHFVQEPFKKVLLPNDYEMDKGCLQQKNFQKMTLEHSQLTPLSQALMGEEKLGHKKG